LGSIWAIGLAIVLPRVASNHLMMTPRAFLFLLVVPVCGEVQGPTTRPLRAAKVLGAVEGGNRPASSSSGDSGASLAARLVALSAFPLLRDPCVRFLWRSILQHQQVREPSLLNLLRAWSGLPIGS
jgi:hypothetical protein